MYWEIKIGNGSRGNCLRGPSTEYYFCKCFNAENRAFQIDPGLSCPIQESIESATGSEKRLNEFSPRDEGVNA
jgi:hypothetical protein